MAASKTRIFFQTLRDSFITFRQNEPLRLAGSTAFFATFALPPILVLITQSLGFVLEKKAVNERMADNLGAFFGRGSVTQLMETLEGFNDLAVNWYIALIGFVFLIFVATTVFKVIRGTINQLWRLRVHRGRKVRQKLIPRLKSLIILLLTGVLFVAALLAEALQALLNEYIRDLWSGAGSMIVILLNQVVSLLIVTVWFSVLFRVLPAGRPHLRVSIVGGLFTGVLFTLGKLLLGILLKMSNIQNIYGAAGSFVLVLLFVFYVSFIFYYGAMFTYCWAENTGNKIAPGKAAYRYQVSEMPATE